MMLRFTLHLFISVFTINYLVSDVQAEHLRNNDETWRLLDQTPEPASSNLIIEKQLEWLATEDASTFHMKNIDKFIGDEAIVVFHDRSESSLSAAEAALVSFDVRSSENCVVSVCGLMRNWYMRVSEQCWELKIAPKSSDPKVNGLIRGISAAYTAQRPVATKMYLKFDSINYIDGSVCEYEVMSAVKTNATQDAVVERL